jgi:hypothetical protein
MKKLTLAIFFITLAATAGTKGAGGGGRGSEGRLRSWVTEIGDYLESYDTDIGKEIKDFLADSDVAFIDLEATPPAGSRMAKKHDGPMKTWLTMDDDDALYDHDDMVLYLEEHVWVDILENNTHRYDDRCSVNSEVKLAAMLLAQARFHAYRGRVKAGEYPLTTRDPSSKSHRELLCTFFKLQYRKTLEPTPVADLFMDRAQYAIGEIYVRGFRDIALEMDRALKRAKKMISHTNIVHPVTQGKLDAYTIAETEKEPGSIRLSYYFWRQWLPTFQTVRWDLIVHEVCRLIPKVCNDHRMPRSVTEWKFEKWRGPELLAVDWKTDARENVKEIALAQEGWALGNGKGYDYLPNLAAVHAKVVDRKYGKETYPLHYLPKGLKLVEQKPERDHQNCVVTVFMLSMDVVPGTRGSTQELRICPENIGGTLESAISR